MYKKIIIALYKFFRAISQKRIIVEYNYKPVKDIDEGFNVVSASRPN